MRSESVSKKCTNGDIDTRVFAPTTVDVRETHSLPTHSVVPIIVDCTE